jgi:hypothetical protein
LNIDEKKIFFALSPHINYYHSYRGDSQGVAGFGKDIEIMANILDTLDLIEDNGFSFDSMKISWDYADNFWSIQLQREFQEDILDRVVERCKQKKDEVIIGSWANVGQPMLDTEEFLQDHAWHLENDMGIGLNQLFPARVAPYARTQEIMFTQGMIELYNKMGIDGICMYYSTYAFDSLRPIIYPRLNTNQRYGLVKFNSSVSKSSTLLIPTYGFGDVVDYFSIKRWFKIIRRMQEKGEIDGHALILINFDMDAHYWTGIKLPRMLRWIPKTGGLMEFAKAVDQLEYVEFANLMDIIPKLPIHGECTCYPDVADGLWNGFYSWAQKYDNTRFWTFGQKARWLKCVSDTLVSNNYVKNKAGPINKLIRDKSDLVESYIKNKCLFASTTNFGLSTPRLHPQRIKTAISYVYRAHKAAKEACEIALNEISGQLNEKGNNSHYSLHIFPIINRGLSNEEKVNLDSDIILKLPLPHQLSKQLFDNHKNISIEGDLEYRIYREEPELGVMLECIIPKTLFKSEQKSLKLNLHLSTDEKPAYKGDNDLLATNSTLSNKYIKISFDSQAKINSFKLNEVEYGYPDFLETAVAFGDKTAPNRFSSSKNRIKVLRDGSDQFSAAIVLSSEFEILEGFTVTSKKKLTLYAHQPYLYVDCEVNFCDIQGEDIFVNDTSSVYTTYDDRWREVMPCEIKPNITGNEEYLRIWKKNYFGRISYFDLDMEKVDSRNADIDCLVANISDGWMALTNRKKGLLVGYNSLKAANFAFTPLKIRKKGFADLGNQEVRINPFGNYHGELLRYWTLGCGHAAILGEKFSNHNQSAAPSYSGKLLKFNLILAPYLGDKPSSEIISCADHYCLTPLTLLRKTENGEIYNFNEDIMELGEYLKQEFNIDDVVTMNYLEWVKYINKDFDPSKPEEQLKEGLNMDLKTMLMMLIDGIRGL